jgi:fused signal recognition particle receptor
MLTENNVDDISDYEIPSSDNPHVVMVVGVNGVGKTTTIGKLAYQYHAKGYKVLLGAADTFRAAAIEQLSTWAERVDVPIIKQKIGSDPASVVFDTIQSGISKDVDYIIIDTAGRLHNKVNLMNELLKIKNVCTKLIPDSPHELVLALACSSAFWPVEASKASTNSCGESGINLVHTFFIFNNSFIKFTLL